MLIHELVSRIERQLVGIAPPDEIAEACYQLWHNHERRERLKQRQDELAILHQAFDDGLEGRPPSAPQDQAYMTEYRSGLNYSGHKICDLR